MFNFFLLQWANLIDPSLQNKNWNHGGSPKKPMWAMRLLEWEPSSALCNKIVANEIVWIGGALNYYFDEL
jgi:hypothetical protein